MLTTTLISHEWLSCAIERSYNHFVTNISCTDTIQLIGKHFFCETWLQIRNFSNYWNITKQENGAQKI